MQFSLQSGQALLWLVLLSAVAWLGLKTSYKKLAALLLFLTFDLIVFGAFVRLSDSGLGCPDWPGCYAQFAPLTAKSDIAAAVAAQGGEHGWVSTTKAWIEMVHRYWASFIGMLMVVLLIKTLIERRRQAAINITMPAALLAVVIAQGLFGKWTVTFKLMPIIVTMHLLGGLLLLSLLVLFYLQHQASIHRVQASGSLKALTLISLILLIVQIALGGWVSTNYAALACGGFPLCQGKAWPVMDAATGFDLTRAMGLTNTGAVISLQALTAIHFAHRLFALILTLVMAKLVWRLSQQAALKTYALAIGAALLLQLFIGIGTVVFDQPLLLAVAHNAGAALLLSVLIATAYKIRVLLPNGLPMPQTQPASLFTTQHAKQHARATRAT
jgi:heme a synthase